MEDFLRMLQLRSKGEEKNQVKSEGYQVERPACIHYAFYRKQMGTFSGQKQGLYGWN